MNHSTQGLPVHCQLLESIQTHVHWVSDAIQPSHLLSSPSPPAFNLFPTSGSFQMSQLFALGGQNIGVSASTSVLPMNIQDWFPLRWTGCNHSDFSVDHLVMSMCRVFSCVVGRGCLLWPVHSLGRTLLAFALLHSVLQSQICLLLQATDFDFLLLHSSPL